MQPVQYSNIAQIEIRHVRHIALTQIEAGRQVHVDNENETISVQKVDTILYITGEGISDEFTGQIFVQMGRGISILADELSKPSIRDQKFEVGDLM